MADSGYTNFCLSKGCLGIELKDGERYCPLCGAERTEFYVCVCGEDDCEVDDIFDDEIKTLYFRIEYMGADRQKKTRCSPEDIRFSSPALTIDGSEGAAVLSADNRVLKFKLAFAQSLMQLEQESVKVTITVSLEDRLYEFVLKIDGNVRFQPSIRQKQERYLLKPADGVVCIDGKCCFQADVLLLTKHVDTRYIEYNKLFNDGRTKCTGFSPFENGAVIGIEYNGDAAPQTGLMNLPMHLEYYNADGLQQRDITIPVKIVGKPVLRLDCCADGMPLQWNICKDRSYKDCFKKITLTNGCAVNSPMSGPFFDLTGTFADMEGRAVTIGGGAASPFTYKAEPVKNGYSVTLKLDPGFIDTLNDADYGEFKLLVRAADGAGFLVEKEFPAVIQITSAEVDPNKFLVIDMGTSSSCAVVSGNLNEFERIRLEENECPSGLDRQCLLSVIEYKNFHTFNAGYLPSVAAINHPEKCVCSPKRYVGSSKDFRVVTDSSVMSVSTDKAVDDLYECIVRGVKREALCKFGKCMITHPSRFTDRQINILKNAAKKAINTVFQVDCDQIELLCAAEPVAAAMSFLAKEDTYAPRFADGENKKNISVLVYDCGGGTIDISLLSAEANRKEMGSGSYRYRVTVRVLGASGNSLFGGEDMTDDIADVLQEQIAASRNISGRMFPGRTDIGDMTESERSRLEGNRFYVRQWADYIKCHVKDKRIELPGDGGMFADGSVMENDVYERRLYPLNGSDFLLRDCIGACVRDGLIDYEKICRPIESKLVLTGEACLRLLEGCSLPPDSLDVILLTGQASRWPQVSEVIEREVKARGGYCRAELKSMPDGELKHCVVDGAAKLYGVITRKTQIIPSKPGVFLSIDGGCRTFSSRIGLIQPGNDGKFEFVEVLGAGCPFEGDMVSGSVDAVIMQTGRLTFEIYESYGFGNEVGRESVYKLCDFECDIPEERLGADYELRLAVSQHDDSSSIRMSIVFGDEFSIDSDFKEIKLGVM